MAIEPAKKVFEIPRIVKREENQGGGKSKKQKPLKQQKDGESRRIDIRV